MANTRADPPRTREAQLFLRCFWLVLLCSALAHLAARFVPVLETPLLILGICAAIAGGYFYLTDPGPPRTAKDDA